MKDKKPKLPLLKWISLILLIISLLFVYFIPRAIMYPDYPIIGWTVFVIIIFIIPISALVTLWIFTHKKHLSACLAVAMPIIIGPTFELVQDHREKLELKKYGTWANAIVVDKKQISKHGGGFQHWAIACRYIVNNRAYETKFHDDLLNIHPIGDTIKIIYSSKFPRIYSLASEWKN